MRNFVELIRNLGATVLWGGLLNWFSWEAIVQGLEQPDSNLDGIFSISDFWTILKSVIFATGDRVSIWLANTSFGRFFELSVSEPNWALSITLSAVCWFLLIAPVFGSIAQYRKDRLWRS